MTETKFTPGPWKFDGEDSGYYDLPTLNIRDKDGYIIAGAVDFYSDPGLSNAHLIAAAPDLYEALDKIMRMDLSWGYDKAMGKSQEIAYRALAKARGES